MFRLAMSLLLCLVTLDQGRLHANPPEHPGPVLSTKDVLFGIGQAYDQGQMACVALNAGHLVLEAHRAQGYATLQYRIGLLEGETPAWGSGVQYAHGRTPALALNAHNQVVEAHAGVHGEELLCMVGTASSTGVHWEPATRYAVGVAPAIALDDQGTVVEVHWDQGKGSLCSRLGRLQGASLTWGDLQTLEPGAKPAVALNAHGAAILVYEAPARAGLRCRLGQVEGEHLTWGPERDCGKGTHPAVAWAGDDLLVEVHHSANGGLVRRLGSVAQGVAWSGETYFDDGEAPALACCGRLLIQTHSSENFSTLYYSASLLLDRSRWMEERLELLKNRTLGQLALPASHDAGMYLAGGLARLGRTQDLNLHDQLAEGVRYFDLRPRWLHNEFYVRHGPITGPRLLDVLHDVRRFMEEGHRELAILKLSHFDGFREVNGVCETYRELVVHIQDLLGPWLVTSLPKGRRLGDLPLGELLEHGGRILVVCDGPLPLKPLQPGIWVYRDWEAPDAEAGDLRVYDRYANTVVFPSMKLDQFTKFKAQDGRCQSPGKQGAPVPCDLFLLSWTLTPPTGVWAVSKEANRKLIAEREFLKANGSGVAVNLFYTDYVEYSHATDMCILALEARELVRGGHEGP